MGWGHLLFAVTVFCGEEGVRRQDRQPGESELEDRLDLITGGLIAPTLPHSQLYFGFVSQCVEPNWLLTKEGFRCQLC